MAMVFAIPQVLLRGGGIRRCSSFAAAASPSPFQTIETPIQPSTTHYTKRIGINHTMVKAVHPVYRRNLSTKSRLGIGGSRLAQTSSHGDGRYASVVATGLQNGVRTFECGHGGEEELRRAYTDAVMYLKDKGVEGVCGGDDGGEGKMDAVTVTARLGYRTVSRVESDDGDGGGDGKEEEDSFPDDIVVEDDAAQTSITDTTASTSNPSPTSEPSSSTAYHNLSREYISHTLGKSPLVELHQSHPNVQLVYMAHNPETQGVQMALSGAPIEDVRQFVKERMTEAFVGLEIGVAEGQIASYGVCSNGLSLPSSHPLHLGWEDLLAAASDAVKQVHADDGVAGEARCVAALSTVQLPANLLETYGLTVARNLKRYLASPSTSADFASDDPNRHQITHLPNSIDVFFTRPLTCYPDRGTGTGKPFQLLDYQIASSIDDMLPPSNTNTNATDTQWTHQMPSHTPVYYTPTLNATMAHFDANHILEAQHLDGRKLTTEERDTLDGCKLLQSMIHDLDANLSSGKLRSYAAYEEELYTSVVPLIHDTFEELDEGSTSVLMRFFRAYGEAVRCSIAKTTRELLRTGGEGGGKYDIGGDESLQDFALKHLWSQTAEVGDGEEVVLADRVIVGSTKPEYVIQAVKAANAMDV